MKTEDRIDQYLNERKFPHHPSKFGHEDEVNAGIKGIIGWLIDAEKAYDNDNTKLTKQIFKNVQKELDTMIKSL
jgi:hypothetical protein